MTEFNCFANGDAVAAAFPDSLGEDGPLIDRVEFDTSFPAITNFVGICLEPAELAGVLAGSPTESDNNLPANWCVCDDGPAAWAGGQGTPGEANSCI